MGARWYDRTKINTPRASGGSAPRMRRWRRVAVQFATMLTHAGVGTLALWRNGVALNELWPAQGATVAEP